MKKKVLVVFVVLTIAPAVLATPPKFKFGEDWWFETPSTINTRHGWKYVLTYDGEFNVSGKVLAMTHFSQEQFMLSPVDVVVGWGDVLVPSNLEKIEIMTEERSFFWRSKAKLDYDYVSSHLLNIHIIPHNKAVADALLTMDVGDDIAVSGRIVDVAPQTQKTSNIVWKVASVRHDAESGDSRIVLVNMLTINNMIYTEGGQTETGQEEIRQQIENMKNVIVTILVKYGIYLVILVFGLFMLFIFNTFVLKGYSAKKSDICVLTTEGRERSFEYLRAFEHFGDDILIALSHLRSKGPTERNALEKKFGKKAIQYLLQQGYLEVKKG